MMRTLRTLALLAACTVAAASCQREADNEPGNDRQEARFTSGITTRASGDAWAMGDKIGIWMVADGGTTAVDVTQNIAYLTTGGDGDFEAVNASETIYFPQNGDKVNFIAYYPWKAAATGGTYSIDLSDQATPENIDLLYVHDTRQFSKSNPTVNLTFKHRLSRIELETVAGDGLTQADLGGMKVTIDGMNTKAAFDILADNISGEGDEAEIEMRPATNGANYDAIIIPASIGADDVTVEFEVSGTTGKFSWTIPAMEFDPGKTYKWKVTVKRSGVSVGNVQIDDWTVEDKGDVDATQVVISEADLELPNCYIVKPGASVDIPLRKAVSAWKYNKLTDLRADAPADDRIDEMVPELVWRDIDDTDYATFEMRGKGANRRLRVTAGAKEGNFVVAAKLGGEIYWSWHIWVTDYDPDNGGSFTIDDGSGNYFELMDRDLGAMSNVLGDPGMIGLHYQWGRKDPIPGQDNWENRERDLWWGEDGNKEKVKVAGNQGNALNSLIYSIRYPGTFIRGNSPTWLWYTDDNDEIDENLWGAIEKSNLYNPCPEGWGLVPASSTFENALNRLIPQNSFDTQWQSYSSWNVTSALRYNDELHAPMLFRGVPTAVAFTDARADGIGAGGELCFDDAPVDHSISVRCCRQ